MTEERSDRRSKMTRILALVGFALLLLFALTLLVFLQPVPSRWCINDNGCMFWRDNLWLTLWFGLPAIGIGASSLLGIRLVLRRSRSAMLVGGVACIFLVPALNIVYVMTHFKWQ